MVVGLQAGESSFGWRSWGCGWGETDSGEMGAGRIVEEACVESMGMGVEEVNDVWGSSGWHGRGDLLVDRGGGVGGRRSRVGDVGRDVGSKGTLECESCDPFGLCKRDPLEDDGASKLSTNLLPAFRNVESAKKYISALSSDVNRGDAGLLVCRSKRRLNRSTQAWNMDAG